MPFQVNPQPHGEPRTDVDTDDQAPADPGSEDEAIAAFNQRRQSQARDQDEDEDPADEPEGDPDPDADEADPDPEDEPEGDLVEVTFEGETAKVPAKFKDALLRKADYSRAMNAVAEVKKDYAQRSESLERREASIEKLSQALAEVRAIDAQLEQFKTVDWDKLEAEDPARASVLGLKVMRLQQARVNAQGAAEAVDRELVAERRKDLQARQAEMVKTLEKEFPGWGDEAGAKVTRYAVEAGWSAEEIREFADPRLVLVLEKARKFDAIQAGKKQALETARRESQPVARPGAPRRSNPVMDVAARFSKSKSPEDAAALFEARAGAKGRR